MMFQALPGAVRGSLSLTLYFFNTLFWCIPLFIMVAVKAAIPTEPWLRGCSRVLNAIAENGCTEFTEYIQTDNQAELQAALELTGGLVIKCVFRVGNIDPTADPEKVNMYFDDEVVPYDPNCEGGVGWTWTSDTLDEIEFCQEACDRLNSGEVTNVHATFGCDTVYVV